MPRACVFAHHLFPFFFSFGAARARDSTGFSRAYTKRIYERTLKYFPEYHKWKRLPQLGREATPMDRSGTTLPYTLAAKAAGKPLTVPVDALDPTDSRRQQELKDTQHLMPSSAEHADGVSGTLLSASSIGAAAMPDASMLDGGATMVAARENKVSDGIDDFMGPHWPRDVPWHRDAETGDVVVDGSGDSSAVMGGGGGKNMSVSVPPLELSRVPTYTG